MSSFDLENLFGVQGKNVLITGGSRGVGKMIATGFVRAGAQVYISARSVQDCLGTAEELNKLGPGKCIPVPANIQKVAEVERLVTELEKNEKILHVLVNNAGAAWGEDIDSYSDDGFSKLMALNVQRVFTVTQKCLPLLRAAAEQGGKDESTGVYRDPARIINIGSVEGLGVPNHETYAYSASKAALHHLSRHLAGRLGPEGITSNTIACGPFESKMMAHTLSVLGDAIRAGIPLNRIGTPEDIAGTAIYLASRAGSFVNGATIALDGGMLVHMPSVKL
ncbi:NAD-P-binding protein [Vararia minispora EC-137]|uniref:NAD-P-binding protein n=1 Tax=Vararia minispora EC-137 TaxID=1314806 RepID=A0ACB8QYH8_9AGAM|nr:NAD-P-binding protein [Vararia minispora EC-137]